MGSFRYYITDHAREEAERRDIPLMLLQSIIESPGQIVDAYNDRKAYQSKVEISGKLYLVRAIVISGDPLTVITIYRTSKIKKYWSDEA